MYVDEAGDPGLVNSPTDYFILSGLVIHERHWAECLDRLVSFRRRMRAAHGLKLREEIHTARMFTRPGALARIAKNDRLALVRAFTNEVASLPSVNIINVVVDKRSKSGGYDPMERAWSALIQRFENTIGASNFPGTAHADERGMIFPDFTATKKVKDVTRRMRRYNPVPNQIQQGSGFRNLKIVRVVEDPSFRDSADSYFVQSADLVTFLLYQKLQPSNYIRTKGAQNHFDRLMPVLCRVAAPSDPYGIVRL